jgi:hypothetical protein
VKRGGLPDVGISLGGVDFGVHIGSRESEAQIEQNVERVRRSMASSLAGRMVKIGFNEDQSANLLIDLRAQPGGIGAIILVERAHVAHCRMMRELAMQIVHDLLALAEGRVLVGQEVLKALEGIEWE